MTDSKDDLLVNTKAEYGENYQQDFMQIYQLYVESADKISDRRHQANSLFLSINTLLVVASAEWLSAGDKSFLWVAAAAGILFCSAWYRILKFYRTLNTGKFKVVHRMEQHLPLAPYDAEWNELGQGKDPKIHQPLTKVEATVPMIFMVFHIIVLILSLYQRFA